MQVWRRFWLMAFLLLGAMRAPAPQAEAPRSAWEASRPEAAGYSSARLAALRGVLAAQSTTAMMVIVHGKVIFSYGDLATPAKIASVRKSILSILFGKYVVQGRVDLSRTVADLRLDEHEPFLPIEQHATVEQLLAGRSGVYLDPRDDELGRQQPVRGSQYPGTSFYYGNWNFDAAGSAFERLTGQTIYGALASDLATTIGMQDFRAELQRKIDSPGSVHPEYAMYLSARDLGRLGLLMLRQGQWNGRQVVPAEWVRYTTAVVTPWDEMNPPMLRLRGAPDRWGFGVGWWVWDAAMYPGGVSASPFQGAFEARGTGGQYLTVLPARDMVLVHQVDLGRVKDANAYVTQQDWDAVTNLVLAATCHGPCS